LPNAENADSVDNSFSLSFRIFSAVIAQSTAHRKITVLWLRLPKSLPVLPAVIPWSSPNILPMAVHLQRKNFSVELKKEGNRQCPLKGIGCFHSNIYYYFLDSSAIFFFSSTTCFLSAFSVFDSVVTT